MSTAARIAGLLALVAAVWLLLGVVTVSDASGAHARGCGSAFDVMTDRTGWREWWSADLDDPAESVRTELVRTSSCPSALNRRMAWGLALGGIGLVTVSGLRLRRRQRPETELETLARWTVVAGAGLTVAGIVAIVALTADSESTLFLYVDRLVVALVGLVVLVPTVSLIVLGRTLQLMATGRSTGEADGE